MYLQLFIPAIVFFLMGLFWIFIGKAKLSSYRGNKRVCTERVIAKVKSVEIVNVSRSGFLPTLEYMAGGKKITVKSTSGGSLFRYTKEIPILYNASNPKQFIFDRGRIYFKRIFTPLFLGAGFCSVGILLCYFSFTA